MKLSIMTFEGVSFGRVTRCNCECEEFSQSIIIRRRSSSLSSSMDDESAGRKEGRKEEV